MEKYPGTIVGQGHEGVPWRVVKQKMPSMVDLRGELGVEGMIFCREFMDDVFYTWMVLTGCIC